jgi:hypothetical protein
VSYVMSEELRVGHGADLGTRVIYRWSSNNVVAVPYITITGN